MTRARDLADGKHLTNVDTDTLVVDAANNRVGIGTSSPSFSNGSGLEVANATTACVRVEGNSAAHALEIYADSNGGTIDARGSGAVLAFDIGGSEKGRFLNGGGLTFNGDTATANALDDYEEGTWTAQMLGSSTNPSNTVLATTASYTKIGSLVWAGATFVGVNTTGASGAVAISGMPFDSNFTVPMGNVMSQNTFNVGSTVANITPFWANSTQVWFYHTLHGSNIWGSVQHSAGTSRYLYLSLIYTTNS
tara:strand:+ start:112 stop:861 length:750 start_codon:yes stop_codon:yes gene_type:complete